VAQLSFSVAAARCVKSMKFIVLNLVCTLEFVGQVCHLSVILFEFLGIPSSWDDAFVEIFKSVCSHPSFHPDSVGSLPIGGEFSLFKVFLVPSEDEVANFEFSLYNFLAMTSGYFLFLFFDNHQHLHCYQLRSPPPKF